MNAWQSKCSRNFYNYYYPLFSIMLFHSSFIFENFPLPSIISYSSARIVLACSLRIPVILRYLCSFFSLYHLLFHSLIFLYFSSVSSESISKCILYITDSIFYLDNPDFTISNTDFDGLIANLVSLQFLILSSSLFISAHYLYTASYFHRSLFSDKFLCLCHIDHTFY